MRGQLGQILAEEEKPESKEREALLEKAREAFKEGLQQKEVLSQCVAAEPRYGEAWCRVSKDVRNWRLRSADLLPMVADSLPIPS
ncbi:unnamed protein product [Rodentolepis nana]|uniref:Clathrin light chain n=1 Tax=Rodentolepis nana TaxID=102285 RepID=A0A0R3TIN7_RODNA|nr:unnamed protein product [Rodentolepis nana]